MNFPRKEMEKRVDSDVFEPELLPLQIKALDDLRAARRLGRDQDLQDCLAVAQELGALRLVL